MFDILIISEDKTKISLLETDIKDNMDLNRISNLTEKDLSRIKKYHRVLKLLTDEIKRVEQEVLYVRVVNANC